MGRDCRVGVLALVVLAAVLGVAPGRVAAAGGRRGPQRVVDLGTRARFGRFVVDGVRGDVFLSEPAPGAVVELDEQGQRVRTFSGLPGAYGLVIVGRYLYVAVQSAGEVARIDLGARRPSVHVFISRLAGARWLAFTYGRLWIGALAKVIGAWNMVSVDPATRRRRRFSEEFYGTDFVTSPADPDALWMAESGEEPAPLHLYRLGVGTLHQTAINRDPWEGNLGEMVLSPDGSRLDAAASIVGPFHELCSQTLRPDGVVYPGYPFPSAVAMSASGVLATALDGYQAPELAAYRVGVTRPFWTATNSDSVVQDGLALSTDGRRLYTAVDTPATHGPALLIEAYALPPTPRENAPNPCPLPRRRAP
jgi:hypothetical protein